MHPWLLSGKEKEPESTFSVNRGRHNGSPPVTVSSRLTVFVGSSGFPWIDCTIAHWRQPFLSLKNAACIHLGRITCYPQDIRVQCVALIFNICLRLSVRWNSDPMIGVPIQDFIGIDVREYADWDSFTIS